MSSRSPQSHKTYDGSPNWWPDHHQHQLPRTLVTAAGVSATASKLAPNGAYGNVRLKKSRQPLRCTDRRFLQQNRHDSHSRDVRLESAKCAKAEIDWSGHDHGRPSPRKTAPDDAARERTGAFTIYAS